MKNTLDILLSNWKTVIFYLNHFCFLETIFLVKIENTFFRTASKMHNETLTFICSILVTSDMSKIKTLNTFLKI